MADDNYCPKCGARLPADAPAGLCPRCLLKPNWANAADITVGSPAAIEGPGTTIGHYELLELIGEGGMGLVYLAEQQEPIRRRVALKIIKPGMDSREVIARFEAERQTLALLDHPNIAHVFDAGMTGTGRPYFVMEYVEGLSITEYCDERTLNVEERLKLFREVCESVHHAHQKGIIHRDIKPSNVLVSTHGNRPVPKIIDFGVAKAITQPLGGTTAFTRQGQLLGTPEYMSPEQIDLATQDIDTRSDIYSLGVLLYELLAGVLPFDRDTFKRLGLAEMQKTIREEEPATPSTRLTSLGEKAKEIAARRQTQLLTLARRLHRELEWIPMKAMRKDRTRRYRSASELADDIQNYLNDAPLIAGPESNVYRARKFVRKHAGSVTSAALVAVVIVLGLITSTAFSFKAEKARGEEAAARAQAEEARDKEVALREQVEQALVRAEEAEAIAEERNEEYRHALYVHSIQLADAKYREGNVRNARTLLESCPEDLRGWEWDRVNHILDQSVASFAAYRGHVESVDISLDGQRVISGGSNGSIKIWDITTGKELTTLSRTPTGAILDAKFSPNGRYIVSGDASGHIDIWDAADVNEPITSIRHGDMFIPCVSFSSDGNQILSTSPRDGTTKVWDVATGDERLVLRGLIRFAAFSPNGKHIGSADEDGVITLWDSVSGDEVMSIAGHDQQILGMSFNSDGSLFASGSDDYTIKIWDSMTGTAVMTLRGHDGPITSVAFSPDDKYVISSSMDCTVRIWDIATGEELRTLRGHEDLTTSAVFTPDGTKAVSGSWDGTIKVWDVSVDHEIHRFLGHRSMVGFPEFSPDGKRLFTKSKDGIVKVWDLTNFPEVMTFDKGVEGPMALSPDGKHIASFNKTRAIVIRNVETGNEVITFGNPEDRMRCLAYSPDSEYIVSVCSQGELKQLKLWDVNNGEEVMTFSKVDSGILSVAFSPDGKQVVSGQVDGEVKLWDAASGAELQSLIGHGRIILRVAFSPDGKFIASACQNDYSAKIWDAATGKELKTLRGHRDIFLSIAYSPDGRRLITGSRDGTVKVWDATTGDELLTLRAGSPVTGVVFSHDGKSIACGTFGGFVVLWESAVPADD